METLNDLKISTAGLSLLCGCQYVSAQNVTQRTFLAQSWAFHPLWGSAWVLVFVVDHLVSLIVAMVVPQMWTVLHLRPRSIQLSCSDAVSPTTAWHGMKNLQQTKVV